MPIPDEIKNLIDRYEVHRAAYLRDEANYNEAKVRTDYIEPFFRALQWDIDNNQGFSEAYREVMLEEPIRIRDKTQYFDYTFRIGGVRKFIVEAKKPAVSIKDNADAALQLRWYAWNAKLPLSILTNFEEFAVYDCNIKPKTTDKASDARIEYFTFKDYSEKWDWIFSIFAEDSIWRGSFDGYAASTKGKKGSASVDDDFLTEIESWRDMLAKNVALRNPTLNIEELNAVVQRTIDRIIFLRICEDRGIEDYGRLRNLIEHESVYTHLCDLYRLADEKYNSGLFYFQKEVDISGSPDLISLSIKIDDKVLKGIIRRLYYPECPYLFSVLSPEILGHVYEQFLGKVIRLTEGHQAKVEYKPEVKKAGGVYYTPQYIVDYIVKNTVGELVKNKTPREVAKLRILDPACGSGSFLLGAYHYLLDWHRDWYISNLIPVYIDKKVVTDPAVIALLPEPIPKSRKKKSAVQPDLPVYKTANGQASKVHSDWKLTTAEKKRILLNNIYGVDIDTQAVEVTKLSLLLKVLEEENEENIEKQLKLFDERALPNLDRNIKCGNSLIGTDIFTPEIRSDEVRRINPFDWEKEFPNVMNVGGFDAVIGNPPYVRQESIKEQKVYFQTHYATYQGTADLYVYFIEKGISLLRKGGLFSYIVANKWMRANYGKPLRSWLVRKRIEEIVDFGDLPVFKSAITYPCIIRIRNDAPLNSFQAITIENLSFTNLSEYVSHNAHSVDLVNLAEGGWNLSDSKSHKLLNKLKSSGIPLEEYVEGKIFYGLKTGLNKAFIIDEKTRSALIRQNPNCENLIKPFVTGRDIKRYSSLKRDKFLIYIPWHFPLQFDKTITGASKKAENEFKTQYPGIYDHLLKFKKELLSRNPAETEIRYEWYALQRFGSNYYKEFDKPKIIIPAITKNASYTFDTDKFYSSDKTSIIPLKDLYLLGLLNSKVIDYSLHSISSTKQRGYFEYKPMYVSKLPIRTINFSDPADKTRHERMVSLVERMLAIHKQKAEVKTDHEKNLIERQIEATDNAIDKLVYELYNLTDEEIKIIEGV